jgi:hypothetical protein
MSFGPRHALEFGAEVLAALVGLPFRLRCQTSFGDSSSPVRGRGVWLLYHCADLCVMVQVGLTVCIPVSVIPECSGTEWLLVTMPWARILRILLLIHLASRHPGPGSWCATRLIAACQSLKNNTFITPCICNVSLFSIATSRACLIGSSSESQTTIRQVFRNLRVDLDLFLCLPTTAAPTRPLYEHDPPVRHIPTPALILASFALAQLCMKHLASAVLSSMVVLTAVSSPRAR